MTSPLRIAVIGHGDDGARLATGLANAGAEVIGFDVRPPASPTVPMADSLADAVAGADVVLSINSPNASLRIAEQAAAHLGENALFADLNDATPSLKRKLAEAVPAGRFVDVAVMAPLTQPVLELPMLLAGPAAARFAEQLSALGLNLEVVSDAIGAAAARKLTRSILGKALAGAVVDFMWTAEAMGLSDWAYQQLLDEFDGLSAESAKRFLSETVSNPKRREIEMLDIVEMLEEADHHAIFVPPTQLVYNKVYHSIKVPFGTAAEQEKFEARQQPPAADW